MFDRNFEMLRNVCDLFVKFNMCVSMSFINCVLLHSHGIDLRTIKM